jgi:hypothetical protein
MKRFGAFSDILFLLAASSSSPIFFYLKILRLLFSFWY